MNEKHESTPVSPQSREISILDRLDQIKHNERGEPLTWGATPLSLTPEISLQQFAVKEVLSELFNDDHIPDFVSPKIATYIQMLNASRTVNRETLNTASYIYRGETSFDNIPFEALDTIDRAIKGSASPAELLLVANLLKIPTIELASLTHPYAQRIEYLGEMRPAVNEAILMMDGTLVQARDQVFEVKGSDNPHDTSQMEGIHMTRKTKFGYLPDGTEIIERSSFVLLVNKLPEHVQKAVLAIPYENNMYWSNQVRRAGKLYEIAPMLLSGDKHDLAIPVSTTIVAINPELEATLLNDDATRARRIQYLASRASKI